MVFTHIFGKLLATTSRRIRRLFHAYIREAFRLAHGGSYSSTTVTPLLGLRGASTAPGWPPGGLQGTRVASKGPPGPSRCVFEPFQGCPAVEKSKKDPLLNRKLRIIGFLLLILIFSGFRGQGLFPLDLGVDPLDPDDFGGLEHCEVHAIVYSGRAL